MSKEGVRFTASDIIGESAGAFWEGHPITAVSIIFAGLKYNQAVKNGTVHKAYDKLPKPLKEFKHNFLSRKKPHWTPLRAAGAVFFGMDKLF